MSARILAFGLPRPIAEELIHRLAREDKYVPEPVFARKMIERGFTMRQVMETLKEGVINQGPRQDEYGDWRCRIKRRVAGRCVHVVVAIHDMRILYLVSVH